MKKFKIFQILCLFFCAAGIYWALKDQDFKILKALHWQNMIFCSALIICGYFFSGLQYYFVLRKMGCPMAKSDILLFPFMQSFWGMIIPVQGSSIFAMYYLKTKYSFQVKQSITMILFLYILNILFASVAGIVYAICYLGCQTPLFWLSLLALFTPLYCFIAHKILKITGKIPFLPAMINEILTAFFAEIHTLFTDWRNILKLLSCQIVRQICFAFMYVQIAKSTGHDVPWLWGYFVTVSQDLTIIIKLTPGNVGVVEMISGFVSALTGVPAAVGINASLFNTLLHMLIIVLIGGFGSYFTLGKGINLAQQLKENRDIQ